MGNLMGFVEKEKNKQTLYFKKQNTEVNVHNSFLQYFLSFDFKREKKCMGEGMQMGIAYAKCIFSDWQNNKDNFFMQLLVLK